jgi:hypothetical protein
VRASICLAFFVCCSLACASRPQGATAQAASNATVTIPIQVKSRNANAMAAAVRSVDGTAHAVGVVASVSRQSLILTGFRSDVDRMTKIIREIDQPECAGLGIWTIHYRHWPSDVADMLGGAFRRWPAGIKIAKLIPDDADHQLIVVGNEAGYRRLLELRLDDSPDLEPVHCGCSQHEVFPDAGLVPQEGEDGPIELPVGPGAR